MIIRCKKCNKDVDFYVVKITKREDVFPFGSFGKLLEWKCPNCNYVNEVKNDNN